MKKLCVISMSGGLDSTTLALKAIEDGYTILPINVKYGQKNNIELEAFKKLVAYFQKNYGDQFMDPIILNLEGMLKTSLDLYKKIRDNKQVEETTGLEFYTPSRNLVFSTLASMVGEIAAIADGLTSVKIGLGIHKHSDIYPRDYWDITPEFVSRLNHLMALNDNISIEMYAPYADQFKSEIVKDGIRLNIPYSNTWTCYEPIETKVDKTIYEYTPCLKCEACLERQSAGDLAGYPDINNYSIHLNKLSEGL